MTKHDKHTLDLCRVTIGDQVKLAIAVQRAAQFNRSPKLEGHFSIVEARWAMLESLVFEEQERIDADIEDGGLVDRAAGAIMDLSHNDWIKVIGAFTSIADLSDADNRRIADCLVTMGSVRG